MFLLRRETSAKRSSPTPIYFFLMYAVIAQIGIPWPLVMYLVYVHRFSTRKGCRAPFRYGRSPEELRRCLREPGNWQSTQRSFTAPATQSSGEIGFANSMEASRRACRLGLGFRVQGLGFGMRVCFIDKLVHIGTRESGTFGSRVGLAVSAGRRLSGLGLSCSP